MEENVREYMRGLQRLSVASRWKGTTAVERSTQMKLLRSRGGKGVVKPVVEVDRSKMTAGEYLEHLKAQKVDVEREAILEKNRQEQAKRMSAYV